jgi:hypothetical protein
MLEQFFSGILQQLQTEVDLINSLVPHNSTKGTLNEQSLHRILASFLPSRYSIGSGLVVDSFGQRSRQVDLVVYDEFHMPKLFRTTSQVLFPVETVFACIEVKTSVSKADLNEIAQENQHINQLKHSVPFINHLSPSKSLPSAIEFSELTTRPPLTFLVAYHCDTNHPLTARKWFEESSEKDLLPDITLLLDLGMIVCRPKSIEKSVFDFLIMPARNTDIGESSPGIAYLPQPGMRVALNGRTYQSSHWKGKSGYPVIMPEKALLSFLVQLSRAIDAFPKSNSFDPTPYLAQYSNEGLEVLNNT